MSRKGYGPVQLATHLGLTRWQLDRALDIELIPPSGENGRWDEAAAAAALARIEEVRASVGSVPDLGAGRTAEELTRRLGVKVTPDGVAELARRGLLPVVGSYKDYPLYDGRVIETFTDRQAAEDANRAGRLLTADDAARYLRIRRADFDHLTRAGLARPALMGRCEWDRRDSRSVPLYRAADLDALAADPAIPWPQIRATLPGHRSPLAAWPAAPSVKGKP